MVKLGSPDGSSQAYQPQAERYGSGPVIPLKFPRLSYRIRRCLNHFGYVDSAKDSDLSNDCSIDTAHDAHITDISIESESVLVVAAILRNHFSWRPGQNEMAHKANEQ